MTCPRGVSPTQGAWAAKGQVVTVSRTDIHRPVKVMMLDPTIRHWFADFHDHEAGLPCDLEEFLSSRSWKRTRCRRQIWHQAPSLCGCWMCSGRVFRRLARRQERVMWRTVRQDLLKTTPEDYEDIDVPPLRGSSY